MENKDVDIFILTYKDFEPQVKSDVYKVIDSRELRSTYKILGTIDDEWLSEWYHMFWIAEHVKLKKYVGFCHYRRYFEFMDDIPNFDEIFNEYDIVTRKPIHLSCSNLRLYELCHNYEDMLIGCDIIYRKFPEYKDALNEVMMSNEMIPCNMVIMKSNDFLKMIDFMKEFYKEFFWRVGTDMNRRVYYNMAKYYKRQYPNNMMFYQSRLAAYVAERILNVWIKKNCSKIKEYDIVITENKYKLQTNRLI